MNELSTTWEGRRARFKPAKFTNHNYTQRLGKRELSQDVWHNEGYNAVCQYAVISKEAWYQLGGCLRKEQEKLSKRPTGSQSLWKLHYAQSRSRRPCRNRVVPSKWTTCLKKLLTGHSGHWWGSGASTGEGSPESQEACRPRDSPALRQSVRDAKGLSGKWRQHGGTSTELRQMEHRTGSVCLFW